MEIISKILGFPFLVYFCLFLLLAICGAISAYVYHLRKETKPRDKAIAFSAFMLLPVLIIVTIITVTCATKLASPWSIMVKSPNELIEIERITPDDQSNEEINKGDIIILYKYGCPDCGAIYSDLEHYLDENGATNIKYINANTEKGRELYNEYQIQWVPTAIYIYQTDGHSTNGQTVRLDEVSNGQTVLDTENLDILINAQKNGN